MNHPNKEYTNLEDKFQMQDELLDFFYNIETGLFNYSKWEKDIGEIIKAILNRKYIQFQYQLFLFQYQNLSWILFLIHLKSNFSVPGFFILLKCFINKSDILMYSSSFTNF